MPRVGAMLGPLLAVTSLLTCLLVVQGAVSYHEINGKELPGWNKPLPSKQYSGYFELDDQQSTDSADYMTYYSTNTKYLHYW